MNKYIFTVRINNSYDVVQEITQQNIQSAITDCRTLIKTQYEPENFWFTDVKQLN